jgi:hypothetical protein
MSASQTIRHRLAHCPVDGTGSFVFRTSNNDDELSSREHAAAGLQKQQYIRSQRLNPEVKDISGSNSTQSTAGTTPSRATITVGPADCASAIAPRAGPGGGLAAAGARRAGPKGKISHAGPGRALAALPAIVRTLSGRRRGSLGRCCGQGWQRRPGRGKKERQPWC